MPITIREYLDESGQSPFRRWFLGLDPRAAAKIAAALYRLEQGNFSGIKHLGRGVFEDKINFGPGYRVYFGRDGEEIIVLLGGGSKKRQQDDIEAALACWKDYKKRRNRGS